ncbi:hypothetical protein CRG98_045868 [Punica granatum]|uniref:Uncharacterized protein n=1 Tax=Punica granatum TaxID=22663 RepID=A0A2I0HR55_PUNGR|nr:hypothetical protein CRG98_045868 [Punica granatum]
MRESNKHDESPVGPGPTHPAQPGQEHASPDPCQEVAIDFSILLNKRAITYGLLRNREPQNVGGGTAEVEVLPFDYSVENHIKEMDMIARLCWEEGGIVEDSEIARLSSSLTFIREWRFFNYEPRVVEFSSQTCSAADEGALGPIRYRSSHLQLFPRYQ